MVFSLTDWTSGSDRDARLASMHLEASKKTTHVIDIRGGPATTPAAAWYMVAGMRCSEENKAALAAALDAYLRGIFHCGTFRPVFHHVGVSKTDPQMVLSVQGWPSRQEAEEYWHVSVLSVKITTSFVNTNVAKSKEHSAFYPAVKGLMAMDLGPFQGTLSEVQQQ